MKITTKEVRDITAILDEIIKDYKENTPESKRDWRTYEQRVAMRLRTAFRELKPLVHEAVSSINFEKGEKRGAKPCLNVEQRTLAVLIKHIIGKSNRTMAAMLTLFSLLSDIDVSYKTIERFYSDPEVILVLHNLHTLLLKKKGIDSVESSGDGTGYALSVKVNYESEAQKLKDKIKTGEEQIHKKRVFVFSFNLMDIKTRMYIAVGTSFKSEKEAYDNAIQMAQEQGIDINSMRLDKYYSNQSDVESLKEKFGAICLYLIPKSNATIDGTWEWKRMLYDFVKDTVGYLEEYFQRNQSESGIAEDKKRVGWKLGQKRLDRINTANFLTTVWHNLYWLG